MGFDRTQATGSGATAQYRQPYRSQYETLTTCPERYLLWFHHVPWTYRTLSGRTLMEELQFRYQRGVSEVEDFLSIWQRAKGDIDAGRWNDVRLKLEAQLDNARLWQQTCVDYFRAKETGQGNR